jgi:hypothetical protein
MIISLSNTGCNQMPLHYAKPNTLLVFQLVCMQPMKLFFRQAFACNWKKQESVSPSGSKLEHLQEYPIFSLLKIYSFAAPKNVLGKKKKVSGT